MPNLDRFADLARKVGVVAPVAPVRSSGDTDDSVKYTQTCHTLSQSVAPVAPVAPVARTNNEGWDKVDWQAAFEERAGILEFDEGLPRVVAERLAREQVFGG